MAKGKNSSATRPGSKALQTLRDLADITDIIDEEFDSHLDELIHGTNDRYVATLGCTVVENYLRHALQSAMIPLANGLKQDLFGLGGPLNTFHGMIAIARSFNIINEDTRNNLDFIKEIRNAFVHGLRPIAFSTKEVADVCHLLTANDFDMSCDERGQFVNAVCDLTEIIAATTKQNLSSKN